MNIDINKTLAELQRIKLRSEATRTKKFQRIASKANTNEFDFQIAIQDRLTQQQ